MIVEHDDRDDIDELAIAAQSALGAPAVADDNPIGKAAVRIVAAVETNFDFDA